MSFFFSDLFFFDLTGMETSVMEMTSIATEEVTTQLGKKRSKPIPPRATHLIPPLAGLPCN